MTHFPSFSVTFPEVRRYRVAVCLERYVIFTFVPVVCWLMALNGNPRELLEQIALVFFTGVLLAVVTTYAVVTRKQLSPVLNEKLRNELQTRTGLVIPDGFPAVDESRSLPLFTADGRVVEVSIQRQGDDYVMHSVIPETVSA